MSETKIHICGCCDAEHVGTKVLTPPDWQWMGSLLVCGDCNTLPANYRRGAQHKRAAAR